jgi:hypothetical protein
VLASLGWKIYAFVMAHAVIDGAEATMGARLEFSGDLSLLERQRRTLLVSRADRNPTPASAWLQNLLAATRKLVLNHEVLVTGTGRAAFDAALFTCALENGAAIVALENSAQAGAALKTFLPARHLLVWPVEPQAKNAAMQRDLLMGALADRAYAVLIRKSGNMARIAEALDQRGCPVETIAIEKQTVPASDQPSRETHLPLSALNENESWEWLTHFTREPDGEFPGESRADYLGWLCGGVPFEARDASASLRRILREKRIRACGRLMPGGAPMVCFTALHPSQAIELRRWRPGLLRWSFTRSAIIIRKCALKKVGARAVTYGTREALDGAAAPERAFMQLCRTEKDDWTREVEWRVAGDVDLSAISSDDMLALSEHASEASRVEREFGIQARVF